MIKLITGNKGSGKTKILIDMANKAVAETTGHIVCIEKGCKLTFELSHKIKLIAADDYAIKGYDVFYGFIAGILATDYDVKEIYVDGILKIGEKDLIGLGNLLDKINDKVKDEVVVVITVSADLADIPESVKKYL